MRSVALRLAARTRTRTLELCAWMLTAYAVKRTNRRSATGIQGSHLEAVDSA